MSNNLHVYLSRIPPARDISSFFATLGFKYDRLWESEDPGEPDCQFWSWHQHPLSNSGIELMYFDSMFADNTKFTDYECSVVLQGGLSASPIDLSMLDITACLLLSRYGGTLNNPQRLDRKFANLFVCGVNNTKGR